jgi:hypothetical protein
MNIVADELCNVIRETAKGTFGVRPNCGLWPRERCVIFIRGVKVKSNWKERLTQQLLNGELQEYIMQKEQWTSHAFNKNVGRETRQRQKEYQRHVKRQLQICVTTQGSRVLVINYGTAKINHASCAGNMKIVDTF